MFMTSEKFKSTYDVGFSYLLCMCVVVYVRVCGSVCVGESVLLRPFSKMWTVLFVFIFYFHYRFLNEVKQINEKSLAFIDDISGDVIQIFQLKSRLSNDWAPILDLIEDSELFRKIPGKFFLKKKRGINQVAKTFKEKKVKSWNKGNCRIWNGVHEIFISLLHT